MTAVPELMPVTTPAEEIEATVLLLAHVPPAMVLFIVIVLPMHT
jgi:hypothetical protein